MGYKFYKFSVNTEDPEGDFLISNLSSVTGAARNLLIRKLLLDYFKGEADKKIKSENKYDEVISKLDALMLVVASANRIENDVTNLSEEIFEFKKAIGTEGNKINTLLRDIKYIELPKVIDACAEATSGNSVEFGDDSYIPDWIRPGYGNAGYRPDGYKRPDGMVIYPRGWNEARLHDKKENWQQEPEYIRKKYYEIV